MVCLESHAVHGVHDCLRRTTYEHRYGRPALDFFHGSAPEIPIQIAISVPPRPKDGCGGSRSVWEMPHVEVTRRGIADASDIPALADGTELRPAVAGRRPRRRSSHPYDSRAPDRKAEGFRTGSD